MKYEQGLRSPFETAMLNLFQFFVGNLCSSFPCLTIVFRFLVYWRLFSVFVWHWTNILRVSLDLTVVYHHFNLTTFFTFAFYSIPGQSLECGVTPVSQTRVIGGLFWTTVMLNLFKFFVGNPFSSFPSLTIVFRFWFTDSCLVFYMSLN